MSRYRDGVGVNSVEAIRTLKNMRRGMMFVTVVYLNSLLNGVKNFRNLTMLPLFKAHRE